MKKIFYVFILAAMLFLLPSACTLHIPPYDFEWDSPVYQLKFMVDPDDAVVLVNGRMKGYAYEFATWDSALRLASRENEIIVKKEGYVEEPINLYSYYSRRITIRLKLLEDKDYAGPVTQSKPAEPVKKTPGYTAKTEPPITPPEEALEKSEADVKAVDVLLEILPEEASIYLNGKFWGISPRNGKIENLRLKPGTYTLEVVKPGYKAYTKELNVAEQKVSLSIKLEK